MACIERVAYEPESSIGVELATPDTIISHKVKYCIAFMEVGDAHSSVDRWDNITHKEQRGIAIGKVLKGRSAL